MKKMYHATRWSNFEGIVDNGLQPGVDRIVYLAETKEEALRFIAIRVFDEPILVLEVSVDQSLLEESFDHNYEFFKARAWGYPEMIPWSSVTDAWKYFLNFVKFVIFPQNSQFYKLSLVNFSTISLYMG